MVFKKGQAALDFLMTYGWAIALVVIVAAALFALSLFDASNFLISKTAGFSGVAVNGWAMDTAGTFTLKLSNPASRQINITGMSVTVGATTAAVNYAIGILSAGAGTDTLSTAQATFGSQTTGSKYAAKVAINYTDMNSGLAYSTTGTITGKVV